MATLQFGFTVQLVLLIYGCRCAAQGWSCSDNVVGLSGKWPWFDWPDTDSGGFKVNAREDRSLHWNKITKCYLSRQSTTALMGKNLYKRHRTVLHARNYLLYMLLRKILCPESETQRILKALIFPSYFSELLKGLLLLQRQ